MISVRRATTSFANLTLRACMLTLVFLAWAPLANAEAPKKLTFVRLHHVSAEDVIQFLRETPSLSQHVEDGSVRRLPGKPKSLVVTLAEELGKSVIQTIRDYESLEIQDRVTMEPVRINYASVQLVLESLAAAGVCQVWHRTEENMTDQVKHGNKTITHAYKRWVYSKYEVAKGVVGLSDNIPEIPYVIEIPTVDPIDIPPINMGTGQQKFDVSRFPGSTINGRPQPHPRRRNAR